MGQAVEVAETTRKNKAGAAPTIAAAVTDDERVQLGIVDELAEDLTWEEQLPWELPASLPPASGLHEFLIRGFDIVGSLTILLAASPVMLVLTLLLAASSSGPVLYRQERVGKGGKIFTLHKFRTMVEDAEKQTGPVWAARNDPRVTRLGRTLRRTHLDELPQLFSVLAGHMSLVGPRPERPYFVRQYEALQGIRLTVKPGVTGLAQIRGCYDLKPYHKARYDYLYIKNRSLILNLYILLRTIPVVFTTRGW